MTQTAKALLVDDRRENLMALEAILQGLPVQSVAVESGEAALKQLLVDDFAVILLDAQMPDMDGFETASHIKRRERTRTCRSSSSPPPTRTPSWRCAVMRSGRWTT